MSNRNVPMRPEDGNDIGKHRRFCFLPLQPIDKLEELAQRRSGLNPPPEPGEGNQREAASLRQGLTMAHARMTSFEATVRQLEDTIDEMNAAAAERQMRHDAGLREQVDELEAEVERLEERCKERQEHDREHIEALMWGLAEERAAKERLQARLKERTCAFMKCRAKLKKFLDREMERFGHKHAQQNQPQDSAQDEQPTGSGVLAV